MVKQPEVSIITVNYNGFHDTCELIESIKRYVTLRYELIVVDNASHKNEAELIKQKYPWVLAIRNEKNLGFAGGNNVGIRASHGKYIFFLNNDTLIKDDSLWFLIDSIESNPKIGAVSPKIKYASSPGIIQYAGYTPFSPITLRNETIGLGQDDQGQYDIAGVTAYLHGAAIMMKREVVKQIGLMPEIYFLYYEELDWCEKMKNSGFECFYEPRCSMYHKESQSTGTNTPLRAFYMTRNRLLFTYRNRNGVSKYLSITYQTVIVLLKNVLLAFIKKRPDLAKAHVSGFFHFIILKNKNS